MNARQFLVVNRVPCGRRARSLRPAQSGEDVYPVDASRRQREAIRPGARCIGVSEPRGVRAANTRRGLESRAS
jgi:hypothetical protein